MVLLGQILQTIPFFMTDTSLNRMPLAEYLPDSLLESFGAVQDEEDWLSWTKTSFCELLEVTRVLKHTNNDK